MLLSKRNVKRELCRACIESTRETSNSEQITGNRMDFIVYVAAPDMLINGDRTLNGQVE